LALTSNSVTGRPEPKHTREAASNQTVMTISDEQEGYPLLVYSHPWNPHR